MKRIIAAFSAAVLMFYYCITVFSFEIDGIDSGAEWRESQSVVLVDGESNCKVTFGLVRWSVDNESNILYLCFKFIEPDLADEYSNVGISLSVENSEPFVVTALTSPNSYDTDRYSFSGVISVDKNEGVTCEIKLGMKYGITSKTECKIRFIDSDATKSNIYDLIVENTELTETTTEKDTMVKTTAEKTSKKSNKTTKNTEKDILEIINPKTTVKPKKTTTQKPEKTSKVKTTKEKTTKDKTAKKNVKSTVKTEKQSLTETENDITQTVTFFATESETVITESNTTKLSTTDGKRYKIITAVAGGLVLLAVAVLGSMKHNKKSSDNENDPKS